MMEPDGAVVSSVIIWYAATVKPALSLNLTKTVFAPSPDVMLHDFEVAYDSQLEKGEPSFEKHIWETPEPESVASKLRLIVVELVYAAPLLMVIKP